MLLISIILDRVNQYFLVRELGPSGGRSQPVENLQICNPGGLSPFFL